MTDGPQRGRGLQTKESGHRGRIRDGGHMRMRGGQNVHGALLERLEVPLRKTAGKKDTTDETREESEKHAPQDHKVPPTIII